MKGNRVRRQKANSSLKVDTGGETGNVLKVHGGGLDWQHSTHPPPGAPQKDVPCLKLSSGEQRAEFAMSKVEKKKNK